MSVNITISDIAKKANVSVATVSRVINNKSKGVGDRTRERVLEIIEEYNYQPSAVARGLVTKKSKIIGVLIPDIANPYYPRLIKGVEEVAQERGYNIILCDGGNSAEKEISYLGFLNEHYVSGIIYNNFVDISDTTLEIIQKSSLPLVFVDSKMDYKNCKYVCIDNEKAMHDMITYLINNGHTKIAFMIGSMNSFSTDERYKGYLKALQEYQIPLDQELIIQGDYVIRQGYKAMGKLLARNKEFTAIACCNDLMAIGALEMLEKCNIKVPEQISVVGFDNIDMAKVIRPKLTTVAQPSYEMGRKSANILIDIIEGKESKRKNEVLNTKIIIRDSVKNISNEIEKQNLYEA